MNYKVCLSTKVNHKTLKNGSGIIVLEPDDYTATVIKKIKSKGYKVLGYLSVGTIEKERSWYKKYKKYGLKKLKDWPNEIYADVRKTNWRCFLVSRAKSIKAKGFDGWWCDNIDVYSEYKSTKMFTAIKAVLKQIKSIGGYVMINGGSEFLDDVLDKKVSVSKFINGYTQEEVFSRITSYKGSGKFGKQNKDDGTYYKYMVKRSIKNKVAGFCLEYTRDNTLKKTIKEWCNKNKSSYYISEDVNL